MNMLGINTGEVSFYCALNGGPGQRLPINSACDGYHATLFSRPSVPKSRHETDEHEPSAFTHTEKLSRQQLLEEITSTMDVAGQRELASYILDVNYTGHGHQLFLQGNLVRCGLMMTAHAPRHLSESSCHGHRCSYLNQVKLGSVSRRTRHSHQNRTYLTSHWTRKLTGSIGSASSS